MKFVPFVRKPLPFLLAMALTTACGGGGDSGGGEQPVTPTTHAVTVNTAAGSADSRLACYKGNGAGDVACGLRMYQVMVEAFANGDDSINYGVGYGPSDHKGDLQGIINSLDYIKSTGVNALWLTPVFNSCGDSVTDKRLAATLMGVFIGPLIGEGMTWREDPERVKLFNKISWLWVGTFLLRLAVQLPLYLSGALVALGIAKTAMGLPIFALAIYLSYLMLKAAGIDLQQKKEAEEAG